MIFPKAKISMMFYGVSEKTVRDIVSLAYSEKFSFCLPAVFRQYAPKVDRSQCYDEWDAHCADEEELQLLNDFSETWRNGILADVQSLAFKIPDTSRGKAKPLYLQKHGLTLVGSPILSEPYVTECECQFEALKKTLARHEQKFSDKQIWEMTAKCYDRTLFAPAEESMLKGTSAFLSLIPEILQFNSDQGYMAGSVSITSGNRDIESLLFINDIRETWSHSSFINGIIARNTEEFREAPHAG